jgi:hypothetical protein
MYKQYRPRAVIVDMDGTLALVDQRRDLAMKPNGKLDWDIFNNPDNIELDQPNEPIIELIRVFRETHHKIIIVTGRFHQALDRTMKWLSEHSVPYDAIHTRADKDYRADTVIKREIYEGHILNHWDARWVIDDRKRVVAMWRNELNLTVLQVAEGDH